MSRQRAEVFFSFVSPYAWNAALGLDRIDDIRWTPFWAPTSAEIRQRLERHGHQVLGSPMPFQKVLYALGHLRRRAAARGTAMALPRDRHADWDLPHLAFLAARKHGKERAFLLDAYTTRWVNGEDITSVECLARIFERIGLDSGAASSVQSDSDLWDEAADGLSRAYRNGVFGVPFFVGAHESYWGIDRMSDFVLELDEQTDHGEHAAAPDHDGSAESLIPDPPPEVVDTIGMYDFDHPGGCG